MYATDIPNKDNIKIGLGNNFLDPSNIIEFYFIEDVTNAAMVGFISFFDRKGALELTPITGHEFIKITYGEKQDKILVFNIFGMKRVTPVTQVGESKDTFIELILVDPIFFPLTLKKYSTSWPINTKLSQIVKDLCRNALGVKDFFKWEDSLEKIGDNDGCLDTFYIPYWNVLETIKWISKRSRGAESKLPGYLFYNSPKGLSYVTLDNLFRNMKVESENGKQKYYRFVSTNDEDDCKILSWSLHPIDYQSLVGLRGGNRIGYDFTSKSIIESSYTYKEVLDKYTMLGTKTLFPQLNEENLPYDFEGDDDSIILKNIGYDALIKRYLTQMMMIITVRGNERRHAGMIIDMIWKSADKNNVSNELFEGMWFVKSITHYFNFKTQPYYQQKMTVVKTAYSRSKTNILMPSKVARPIMDRKSMGQ